MRNLPAESSAEHKERSRHGAPARAPAAPENPILAVRGQSFDGVGNRALLSLFHSGQLQRKARLSRPGDPCEHEADRAAGAVVSNAGPVSLAGGGRSSAEVRRAPAAEPVGEPETRGPEPLGRLSGGSGLDEQTRGLMESRFGEAFDDVRIHTGHRAGELADSVRARAFTVGSDIVFADGQFAPGTAEGGRLLAHELAHVVQQRRSAGAVAGERDAERDAHEAARVVASGGKPAVRERAAAGMVQKEEKGETATTKPSVATSTSPIHSEANSVSVAVVGRTVAVGRTSSLDHPRDDGGVFDRSAKILTIRVYLARFGTLSPASNASAVARDLGLNGIVIIRMEDGEAAESFTIVADAPKPPTPKPQPPPPPPSIRPVVFRPETQPDIVPVDYRPKRAGDLTALREHMRQGADDLDGILPQLSDEQLTQLTVEERKDLLNWLTWSDERTRDNQDSLLRLLSTTPEPDARGILDALRADDARLTQKLHANFDPEHRIALHKLLKLIYFTTLSSGLTITDLGPTKIPLKRSGISGLDRLDLNFDFSGGKLRIVPQTDRVVPEFRFGGAGDLDPHSALRKMLADPFGQVPEGTPAPGFDIPEWVGEGRLSRLRTPGFQVPFDFFQPAEPKMPILGDDDFLTRFIEGPEPTQPLPSLSTEGSKRLRGITAELDATLASDKAITGAFQGLPPGEFQALQENLGDPMMSRVFDRLDPFHATLLGTLGPVAYGRDKLNEKRAEFLIDVAKRGAPSEKRVFYMWLFAHAYNDDIRSVLEKLAADSHLHDTLYDPAVAGFLPDFLKNRGIELDRITETKLGVPEGIWRGLGHMGRGLVTNPNLPQEGATWWLELPESYRKMYQDQVSEEFFTAINDPKNWARAMASEMTFGFSDIPLGLYHGGSAAISAIAKGEPGQAAEAITPAAAAIAVILITHKAGKGQTGTIVAEVGTEAESKAFTLPNYKGPASPAAARVRALLAAKNPAVADMSAQVVDRLGVEGVEKAARYIQGSSAAARFVMNNGVAGLEALVAAEGDVAAAAGALQSKVPAVPRALPPGPQPKLLLPGPQPKLLPQGQAPQPRGSGLTIELTPQQAEKLASAENAGKWTDLPGQVRTSLGKRYGYIVEELVRTIAGGGRAKRVLHYADVTPALIKELEKEGGRIVVTQGRLSGGKMRFDIAEIDFDAKKVELIDLAPTANPGHVSGTADYAATLRKLTGFEVEAFELHYVGADKTLLDELNRIEVKPAK